MADNWEYHQDERDRAYAIGGCLMLLTFGIIVLGIVAMVVLTVMGIFDAMQLG